LTDAQRAARTRAIALLHDYRMRADFCVLTAGPLLRGVAFIDPDGRRCAVGELLDRTGRQELPLRVAATGNEAWVCELAGDAALREWAGQNGLTMAEVARIQGPHRAPPPPPRGVIIGGRDAGGIPVIGGPVPSSGPGDARPSRPPSASPAPARGGAQPQPAPRTAARGPAAPGGAPATQVTSPFPSDWSGWWHFNREAYVAAAPPVAPAAPAAAGTTLAPDFLARARAEVAELCARQLADPNGAVRAAAAHALAGVRGDAAVDRLVPLLADPSQEVRCAAILALGETGSARAQHTLSWLAGFGHTGVGRKGGETAPVATLAQPLAVIALGLARAGGENPALDALVAQLDPPARQAAPDLEVARLFYRDLARGGVLGEQAKRLAASERDPALRCRAIESLGTNGDEKVMGPLMRELSGRNLAARRSAALALARVGSDLATPGLMTALELEREQLTRGFLLLAIGQRGDAAGAAFLLEMAEGGDKAMRPWCALALGVHARSSAAAAPRQVVQQLEKLLAAEVNREMLGAYLIALGLARSAASEAAIVERLRTAKSSLVRASAAEALGLLGTDGAKLALREHLPLDACPYVRVVGGEALASFGDAADGELVLGAIDAAYDDETASRAVAAASRLATPKVVADLCTRIERPAPAPLAKALALRALGTMLALRPVPRLASLGVGANYLELPGWVVDLVHADG
jgi:HEAT repeat protein